MPARRLVVSLGMAVALGCASGKPAPSEAAGPKEAVDLEGIDQGVKAGDDFFAYTNGAWIKSTEIPPDRAVYGTSSIVEERTTKRTADLIREAAASPGASAEAQKVGDYFASYLDEEAIEKRGLEPLKPTLEAIAAIHDVQSLSKALGATLRADVDVLNNTSLYTPNVFGLWVAQDLDDPTKYTGFLLQGGLGLLDRSYYTDPGAHLEEIRKKYPAHLAAMLELLHVPDAQAKAQRVYELERRIAETHVSRADSEDVKKGNNHWTRAEFDSKAPGMDWAAYFGAAGLTAQSGFVVWHPSAIIGTSALVKSVPVETWKEYLLVRKLEAMASVLPKAFGEEAFAFHGKVVSGALQQRDRWKRAVAATDRALGEAVGKLYVERYFPPSEKARCEEMVQNELVAFAKRIDALEWMAPSTKEQAKAKLKALKVGVGYPDKWRDYSGLVVTRGDAFGNAERASMFEYQRNLKKFGQPIDRDEWVMNPQLVNAVNLPAMNALNFPAAILQPPDFDPNRTAASNYGATGATIGHEISHSFDDQGALFDAQGRLHNWWTPEDFAHFAASSEALVKQYDGYRPFADLAVNGRQTVSENIADVAGLAAAYDAYKASLGGKEAPVVQGLTGDQQFFISFAQSWRQKQREAALRQRILVDGHAPAQYRADTVRNLDAWYLAFAVQPGQGLYLSPAERVRVW
ncbi:MAG: M13 family metallopeptidase [Deltaproteobacteria bacterium]|nr:M13 family metallopeptidase [Deltaproteobacteria bacterium]